MFKAVKVFSASTHVDREQLGQRVTEWLMREMPDVVDKIVTQSSDRTHHLVTITFFYNPNEKIEMKPLAEVATKPIRLKFKDAR